MNKNDLVGFIARDSGLTKTDSAKALDAFIKAVGITLKSGEELNLIGFGKFYVSHRKATVGRNPKTLAAINIPPATLPRFKAGKVLKDAVS